MVSDTDRTAFLGEYFRIPGECGRNHERNHLGNRGLRFYVFPLNSHWT